MESQNAFPCYYYICDTQNAVAYLQGGTFSTVADMISLRFHSTVVSNQIVIRSTFVLDSENTIPLQANRPSLFLEALMVTTFVHFPKTSSERLY